MKRKYADYEYSTMIGKGRVSKNLETKRWSFIIFPDNGDDLIMSNSMGENYKTKREAKKSMYAEVAWRDGN